MSKKVKIFAIVVGVIAVLILAFTYLGGNSMSTNSITAGVSSNVTSAPVVPTGVGATNNDSSTSTFTALLSSINGITLDTSIFSNPGYKALRDYPLSLGTAVIGRQNPFAPLGSDSSGGSGSTAATIQVQTLAPGKILSTSAELGALVTTTNTSPTTVVFQYGINDTLGSSSGVIKVTKNGTALFTATGLLPATTYYVEAVAVQGSSTATGTIMSFTTAAQQKR